MNIRTIIYILLAICLLAPLLTGCGAQDVPTDADKTDRRNSITEHDMGNGVTCYAMKRHSHPQLALSCIQRR